MLGQRPPSIVTERVPGPASVRGIESLARTECPSFTMRRARRRERSGAPNDPLVWVEAKGCNVRDADGNVFVDMIGAFSVCAVGHAHPEVVAAARRQVSRLPHALGDVHPSAPKLALLESLVRWVGFDARVILGLNGADALAAALKTALLATSRPGIVAFEGGYHGLMYGPLAICGSHPGFRAPFAAQLNPHVRFAPYGSLDALAAALDDSIGAVVVEPALGRGGIVFAPDGFLEGASRLCRERGALLVLDEIFTGLGRVGKRFAHEGVVQPDLLCVGKALGGGLPISACIGREEVMRAWGNPDAEAIHTATFAGSPVSCAAASASLEVIERERLVERSRDVGARWIVRLRDQLGDRVREVRGRGLMMAVELTDGRRSARVAHALLQRGWLTLPVGPGGASLQLTPPLVIAEGLLEEFGDVLASVLDDTP